MTTKAEWKLATKSAKCPVCTQQGQIVKTIGTKDGGTEYTFSCNCTGRHMYYSFTINKNVR